MASEVPAPAPAAAAEASAPVPTIESTGEKVATAGEAGSSNAAETSKKHSGPKRKLDAHDPSLEPMSDVMYRRVCKIQEGDNVLLKLPSDSVKALVASKDGLIQLGKFGSFPASLLIGLPYDITYEVYPDPNAKPPSAIQAKHGARAERASDTSGRAYTDRGSGQGAFGQAKGKKNKKGKDKEEPVPGDVKSNPGWNNILRPLRRSDVVDAIVDDIVETNEFIDDTDIARQDLLTQEEIAVMKAQGVSAEDMMKAQIARHERFDLKTDFSKEKWRKRKEKKYQQTIHPISPSAYNMTNHYFTRNPQNILGLREDTLSQLLTLSNVRPGGRYLVVDDTGGLVTAALMERIGCDGRVMTFTVSDSPPAWGILNVMNFSQREMACVSFLNWMEAAEDYTIPPLPEETDMPAVSEAKTIARQRKHWMQSKELNKTRDELHTGNWDGLIMSTELNPLPILDRLSPYLAGSATVTVYSPHLQILAECLKVFRHDPAYLNANLTESWSRTYQVLPGRTHPTMTTSATGGYLLHATKVIVGAYEADSYVPKKRNRIGSAKSKAKPSGEANSGANGATEVPGGGEAEFEDEDMVEVPVVDEMEI